VRPVYAGDQKNDQRQMTIEAPAEFIASHLWAVLFIITSVMLLLAWLLWEGLQRYGPRIVTLMQNLLARLSPHAQRLPFPGAMLSAWGVVRRLGVQVLVSMAVAVTACIGFVEIADEMAADEDLGQFDSALSAALGRHASDAQLQFFATLTDLGDRSFLIALAGGIAVLLLFRRRWFMAAAWVVATAGGGFLTTALKALFERSRPEWAHGFASADGWSFPSGHASGASIVYGLLAYLVVIHLPKRLHLPLAAVAMTLIVCVGFSRVILQVHYFSDVLGGFAFGAAWVAAWIAGLEAFRGRQQGAMSS
jgi:membrane-associated phospholipid phosphatase